MTTQPLPNLVFDLLPRVLNGSTRAVTEADRKANRAAVTDLRDGIHAHLHHADAGLTARGAMPLDDLMQGMGHVAELQADLITASHAADLTANFNGEWDADTLTVLAAIHNSIALIRADLDAIEEDPEPWEDFAEAIEADLAADEEAEDIAHHVIDHRDRVLVLAVLEALNDWLAARLQNDTLNLTPQPKERPKETDTDKDTRP